MVKAAARTKASISSDILGNMDKYWRAANYLSVGQIYLMDNPLYLRITDTHGSFTALHIKGQIT